MNKLPFTLPNAISEFERVRWSIYATKSANEARVTGEGVAYLDLFDERQTRDQSTIFRTNMPLAGKLPKNNYFLIEGFGLRILRAHESHNWFYSNIRAELYIRSTQYLSIAASECAPSDPMPYFEPDLLFPFFYKTNGTHTDGLMLYPEQNFSASVYWPHSEDSPDADIRVVLDGTLYRRYR